MTISDHLTTFAGLPVVAFGEDRKSADPDAAAWRIDVGSSGGNESFEPAFERLLELTAPAGPTALIIGDWDEAFEDPFPFDLLIRNAARLGGLRSLFIGELTFEECEISWIKQGDVTPVLEAFPALERLWVRGSDGLEIKPLRHEGLRELVLQSGGLPAAVVRAVAACDLPHLPHHELWLGVDG